MKAFLVRAHKSGRGMRAFIVVEPDFYTCTISGNDDDYQPRARVDVALNMAPEVARQLAADLIAAADESEAKS